MSEFVEECRREWRRLGVPDPIANEMAADLTADLEEAEAEGGSAEDVLGNSAFDPRRFAAAWAVARGVTNPPTADRPSPWRAPIAIAAAALLGLLVMGGGLALVVGSGSRSISVATRRVVGGPGPIRIFGPGPNVGPGRFVLPFVGSDFHPLALLVFVVGVVGVVGLGLLAVLYWSPWPGRRRFRRLGGRQSPNWN